MSNEIINKCFKEHEQALQLVKDHLHGKISDASELILQALKKGNKLLLCGNGGSAADAQHIAAEFTGRFVKERKGLPAIALTTDTSALTAIGNDYGYSKIFSRQLEALGNKGDILIAISTSGNSDNIIQAIEKAKELGLLVIGLSGNYGGKMNESCDINVVIPMKITARIQEMHILAGHIICGYIDNLLLKFNC